MDKLILKDFQAHKKLVIPLDQNVTAIVGKTDAGKSAIIRALVWLALNKPNGTAFIRRGARAASVLLKIDGHKIKRVRSKSKNAYVVDGKTLKAFSSDVPDDVAKLLNVSELNFQAQHDSPFWFSESAGYVSRQLNQIVDLGIIDKSLQFVAARLRKERATVEVCKERLSAAKKRVRELGFVSELSADLESLQSTAHELTETEVRLAALRNLIVAIESQQAAAEQEVPDMSAMHETVDELRSIREKRRRLETLVDDAEGFQVEAARAEERLHKAEHELQQHTKGRCPICGSKL